MIKRYITNIFKNKKYYLNNKQLYIDKIEMVIHNPSTVSKMNNKRNFIFESMVYIKKDDMTIHKSFSDDDFDKLMNQIQTFIHNRF